MTTDEHDEGQDTGVTLAANASPDAIGMDTEDRAAVLATLVTADNEETAEAAFDKLAADHLTRYRAILPQVVADLRRESDATQDELAKFYSEAFFRYDACFRTAFLTGSGINDRNRVEAITRQDRTFEVLARLQSWALLTASEARTLIFTGHGGGAMALARRMLELAVIGAFIREKSGDVAERYVLHANHDELKWATEFNDAATALGEDGIDADELKALKDRCDKLAATYHPNYLTDWGWAAKALHPNSPNPKANFADIMKATSLSRFRSLYLRLSHRIHGGASGSAAHVEATPRGRAYVTGPSITNLALPASAILHGLLQCTSAFAQHEYAAYRVHSTPAVQITNLRQLANEAVDAFNDGEARVAEALQARDAAAPTDPLAE